VQPISADTGELQKIAGHPDFFVRLNITFQVMAVAEMSPGDQSPVTALFEGLDDKERIHPARAHDTHGPEVGRILQPRHPGQVGPGIRAPVAEEGHDFGFVIRHEVT
jgi:hypothetical protein